MFLCSSERRVAIWGGLENFLGWAAPLPLPTALLIDGSYVTDKVAPNDVDVVVDLTGQPEPCQLEWFSAYRHFHSYVKDTYMVDFYPFVVGQGSDFSAFFQYVRVDEALQRGLSPTDLKGILRVPL